MVTINVAQLLKSSTGSTRELSFSERLPDPAESVHLLSPVTGHARLLLTSRGVLVQLKHRETAQLECARCLREVAVSLSSSVDEEYRIVTDVRTGLPVPQEEDDQEEHFTINEHHEIQLDELIRQTILTSLPLRPLCEAACPGLCPTCGERLDDQHQPHPSSSSDAEEATSSPFAVLSQLLGDQRGASED